MNPALYSAVYAINEATGISLEEGAREAAGNHFGGNTAAAQETAENTVKNAAEAVENLPEEQKAQVEEAIDGAVVDASAAGGEGEGEGAEQDGQERSTEEKMMELFTGVLGAIGLSPEIANMLVEGLSSLFGEKTPEQTTEVESPGQEAEGQETGQEQSEHEASDHDQAMEQQAIEQGEVDNPHEDMHAEEREVEAELEQDGQDQGLGMGDVMTMGAVAAFGPVAGEAIADALGDTFADMDVGIEDLGAGSEALAVGEGAEPTAGIPDVPVPDQGAEVAQIGG